MYRGTIIDLDGKTLNDAFLLLISSTSSSEKALQLLEECPISALRMLSRQPSWIDLLSDKDPASRNTLRVFFNKVTMHNASLRDLLRT
ncbi:hypothetical protein AVEN_214361-1 [Araneus ventricosus]|uniref:Uncharacterized protein n=1 Tax=Araneus ventricosus TaxID=182803 RepID=A0A4Y2PB64_ARAVE|nr:hypothetical protein AVEN_214361-1 [Araneus ventricosus]